MTSESERDGMSDSEQAAREWAENRLPMNALPPSAGKEIGRHWVPSLFEARKQLAEAHLAGQSHGEKRERERLEREYGAIGSVMRIRCMKHREVPQLNTAEINEGECGACVQVEAEKRGFYTAIARMESALQKISDEAKEKWPDCPDWWGVVWGMKTELEKLKEA